MNLVLSPHNDDESLFIAFTVMRERPLVVVVTDSRIQFNRGELHITADIRWEETKAAMALAGVPCYRLGIKDSDPFEEAAYELRHFLSKCAGFEKIYIPAIQGGNPHHDLVGHIAPTVFEASKITRYTTYTKTELYTTGTQQIIPTEEEMNLKNRMLDCYKTQLNLMATKPHFDAVRGRPEWFV